MFNSLKGLLKKSKDDLYTVKLENGVSIAMLSDKNGKNFQRQFKHCVPKRKNLQGYRINITFRSRANAKYNVADILSGSEHYEKISDNCYLVLWKRSLITKEIAASMRQELMQLVPKMHTDKTLVYGKWYDNNGRKVTELGWKEGMTYTYAGKTTRPGYAFSDAIRQVVEQRIAPLFGVLPADIWAHVVYYPPASSLGWHSDAEEGIDPHFILSTTFLERPSKGARDFQVKKR